MMRLAESVAVPSTTMLDSSVTMTAVVLTLAGSSDSSNAAVYVLYLDTAEWPFVGEIVIVGGVRSVLV